MLNRVPFGKFNRVNALIRGDLSVMRDVAFLVRLPEGAAGIQRFRLFQDRALAWERVAYQRRADKERDIQRHTGQPVWCGEEKNLPLPD